MSTNSSLALYTQLDAMHSAMHEAALRLDWDTVVALQNDTNRTLLTIAKLPDQPLSNAERQEKARLIKQILAKQILIRQEISDWQADVRPLLDAFSSNAESATPG